MQLHHGIDLKRTVVGYFGVLDHSIPLVELHTARQVLLVPKHHLILGDACSQLQPERAAEPVRHNLQSPSLGRKHSSRRTMDASAHTTAHKLQELQLCLD